MSATPWLRFNLFWGEHPVVMPWGAPKFQVGLIVAALAGYLASMIESFGDYHGAAAMAKKVVERHAGNIEGVRSDRGGCSGPVRMTVTDPRQTTRTGPGGSAAPGRAVIAVSPRSPAPNS